MNMNELIELEISYLEKLLKRTNDRLAKLKKDLKINLVKKENTTIFALVKDIDFISTESGDIEEKIICNTIKILFDKNDRLEIICEEELGLSMGFNDVGYESDGDPDIIITYYHNNKKDTIKSNNGNLDKSMETIYDEILKNHKLKIGFKTRRLLSKLIESCIYEADFDEKYYDSLLDTIPILG